MVMRNYQSRDEERLEGGVGRNMGGPGAGRCCGRGGKESPPLSFLMTAYKRLAPGSDSRR